MAAKVKMLVSAPGCPDGVHERHYPVDDVYEVGSHHMPEDLARVFVAEGFAEHVTEPKKSHAER